MSVQKRQNDRSLPRLRRRVYMLACFLLLVVAFDTMPQASSEAGAMARTPHVLLTLYSEQARVAPGTTTWLGLAFRLRPNWHIYWRNPGDSGYPPRLDWHLPDGVHPGDIRWPIPQRLMVGPLANFAYRETVLLAVPLTLPTDFPLPSLRVQAAVNWLVCEQNCIPESATVALDLPVGVTASADPGQSARFAAARAQWPTTQVPAGWQLTAAHVQGGTQLHVTLPDAEIPERLEFFPYAEGLMDAAAPQELVRKENHLMLALNAADPPLAPWQTLHGVLVSHASPPGKNRAFEIDLPIAEALPAWVSERPAFPGFAANGLLPAMLLAFCGGLLLNLMPCVFPVLSIKLLALIGKPGQNGRQRPALLYSAGVIASFLILASTLLLLRAGGHALGWGFQLQSPAVVALLALLFFTLGLSLSGALPIQTLAQDAPGNWRARHPDGDAIASGMLAVLVASPCTAPFMGAALGAAFTLPAAQTLTIFASLGAGMAFPFVLLAFFPQLQRRLPPPGAWMERLKELLALPLFATVVWLCWVLAEQVGPSAVVALGGGLICMGLLTWCLRLEHKVLRRGGALLALIGAISFSTWPTWRDNPSRSREVADGAVHSDWQDWSEGLFAAARRRQQPVFVDFTAAWCVTCQVNKRLVLDRPDVLAGIAAAGVLMLRADWTVQDPAITAELTRLGRSGVPVYALYPAQGPPRLLPEILTSGTVLEAVRGLSRPTLPDS